LPGFRRPWCRARRTCGGGAMARQA
jgi:hypothetical protein